MNKQDIDKIFTYKTIWLEKGGFISIENARLRNKAGCYMAGHEFERAMYDPTSKSIHCFSETGIKQVSIPWR